MASPEHHILVVDDDPELAQSIAALLREVLSELCTIHIAGSMRQALSLDQLNRYSLYLLDFMLQDGTGLELLQALRGRGGGAPVIFITGRGAEQTAVEAMKAGAADYLQKGSFTPEQLSAAVHRALQSYRLQAEKRAAEERLLQSERRFRALIERSMDGISLLDSAGQIRYSSPSALRVIGVPPEQLNGRSAFELVHPQERASLQVRFQRLLADPGGCDFAEARCRHADGNWRWLELTATNLLDDPAVQAIVLNYRDITDRRAVAEALRTSEECYRQIVDTSQEGILTTDTQGCVTYANQRLGELLASDPASLVGQPFLDLLCPEARTTAARLMEAPPGPAEKDICFARQAGGPLWAMVSISPLTGEDGQPLGALAMITDITRRKQAEKRLELQYLAASTLAEGGAPQRAARKALQAICTLLEFGAGGLWVLDEEARLLRAYAGWAANGPDAPEMARFHAAATRTASSGPPGLAWATAKPVTVSLSTASPCPEAAAAAKAGMRACLAFPVLSDSKVLGVVELFTSREISDAFDVPETARALGNQFAQFLIRRRTEEALQEANVQLVRWVTELEARGRQISLLSEMSDLLQACLTTDEAYHALQQLAPQLFPDISGELFLQSANRSLVESIGRWGDHSQDDNVFTPHDCWALRRGRVHHLSSGQVGIRCQHVPPDLDDYCCIPLVAQGEAMGVLHLRPAASKALAPEDIHLGGTVAEHVAMSLANLRLRETLQNQSTRDSLTGLYNRRHMEDTLQSEIHRAERRGSCLGVVMLDLDDFKQINDSLGHDAGDAVLREFGAFLNTAVRRSDTVCRYGGEEFMLLLPSTGPEQAVARTEQLRQQVASLRFRDQSVGPITLSAGVALYPQHGQTAAELTRAADAALYRAKRAGRNQVILAEPDPTPHPASTS